ncbi:hypothetical protein P389DRAFT_19921 [Cystobasidium minutum MCA 4210]|uniref:uncharacterized protein n=1 Tax=Cystobasidium minutum MCA 4210 TaxID=1397322 RepID=UPI0034CE3022|eukprot:jgi/Rhomi1/19921/CE19920_99
MPKGHKAPSIFAQSLVYSVKHCVNDMIVDDWTAPKVISFDYEFQKPNDIDQSRTQPLPQSATFSHLAVAGSYKDGDVTVQQAALFMLADNMAATQSLRPGIHKHFNVDKSAKFVKDPVYHSKDPPKFESRAGNARLTTRKLAMARAAAAKSAEPLTYSPQGESQEPIAGAMRIERTPYASFGDPYKAKRSKRVIVAH